jgi:hypothetical protein
VPPFPNTQCDQRRSRHDAKHSDRETNAVEPGDSDLSIEIRFVLWRRIVVPCTKRKDVIPSENARGSESETGDEELCYEQDGDSFFHP